jgi:hypothetical protein
MRGFGRRDKVSSIVYLNVYDLNPNNDYLYSWGLGMYHSGVEINGTEYTFGSGSGLFTMPPRNAPGARFREAIDMGPLPNDKDIDRVLDELRPEFKGSDYNLLTKNCNHFAEAFVKRLLMKSIPGYVNRMAYVGSLFSCLLPPSLTNSAPVDNGDSSTSPLMASSAKSQNERQTVAPFSGSAYRLGALLLLGVSNIYCSAIEPLIQLHIHIKVVMDLTPWPAAAHQQWHQQLGLMMQRYPILQPSLLLCAMIVSHILLLLYLPRLAVNDYVRRH